MLATLSDLIARERAGEVVERSLIRAATQMLVDLGPATYEADFERPFLAAAAAFYAKEAQAAIAGCSCPEYLKRAERRLAEEAERVRAYLDASTEPRVTRVVENELLREQARVWGGVCKGVGY
jgi:cullin 3